MHLDYYMSRALASVVKSCLFKNKSPILVEKHIYDMGLWKTFLCLFLKQRHIYRLRKIFCGWGYIGGYST